MKKFKVTETHNPQDFFNGIEPPELSRTYWTDTLEESTSQRVLDGFTVIVTEVVNTDADV